MKMKRLIPSHRLRPLLQPAETLLRNLQTILIRVARPCHQRAKPIRIEQLRLISPQQSHPLAGVAAQRGGEVLDHQ